MKFIKISQEDFFALDLEFTNEYVHITQVDSITIEKEAISAFVEILQKFYVEAPDE